MNLGDFMALFPNYNNLERGLYINLTLSLANYVNLIYNTHENKTVMANIN